MTKTAALTAVTVLILAAIAVNSYISLHDHGNLAGFVHAESVQRVHTIGERCESTDHQRKVLENNLPSSSAAEAAWFQGSYERCLKSLAKVEARAGAKYRP